MKHASSIRRVVGVAACGLLTGCALLTKADPVVPRYFTPEQGPHASEFRPSGQAPGSARRQLRLGSIRGGSQLREPIMFRASSHELGYYDDRRWTERPEAYLRRALARTLFEERGVVRVVSGIAPTLDAELVAFEEIRAPRHAVRVQVIITLDDDRVGSVQETITVEQPVAKRGKGDDTDADAAVDAIARALQQCVTRIADQVIARLVVTPEAPEASVSQP